MRNLYLVFNNVQMNLTLTKYGLQLTTNAYENIFFFTHFHYHSVTPNICSLLHYLYSYIYTNNSHFVCITNT
jgi:hypothetical protein